MAENLVQQASLVGEAPSFEEAYRRTVDLRREVLSLQGQYQARRGPLVEAFKAEIDAAFEGGRRRMNAVDLMLAVIGKVAGASANFSAYGQDYSQDALRIFEALDGLALIPRFQAEVREQMRIGQLPQTIDGAIDAAGHAADALVSRPGTFGRLRSDIEGAAEAIKRLANNLRVYSIADFCSGCPELDITQLLERPNISHWIARRAGGPVLSPDSEDGVEFSSAEQRLPSAAFFEINLHLTMIERLCAPEPPPSEEQVERGKRFRLEHGIPEPPPRQEPPPPNRADRVVEAIMFSLVQADNQRERVLSAEYQAAAAEVRAEFARIVAGTHPDKPTAFDRFFVAMLNLYDRKNQIHEAVTQECQRIFDRHHPAVKELDDHARDAIQSELQPALDISISGLLAHPLPWDRSSGIDWRERRKLVKEWSTKVSGDFGYLRLVECPETGEVNWASDLAAGRRARDAAMKGGKETDKSE